MLKSFTRSFSSTASSRLKRSRVENPSQPRQLLRVSAQGREYITYNLAVSRYNSREQENTTTWYRIAAFDENQINKLKQVLRVGNLMHVDCSLSTSTRELPEGKTIHELNLVHRNFDVVLFGKKNAEGEANNEAEDEANPDA
ncbi:RIM1 [[Candida] subhashii]|uniref:RIM1 n=1 Tax=[Candida] subhashii TaxID=561895 RepID=A0A8J5QEX8_9ASCO|nr:RIM1 [[Candida] subhashii]KAG7661063.1 RIM1 [[Candida] subhashii]